MTPLRLWQSGEYDADFEVVLEADGRFSVERGSYVTGGRRYGTLTSRQQADLERLIAAVDLEAEYPVVETSRSVLEVGDEAVTWSGAPPVAGLRALMEALVRL
ncbi:hypothetical protein [Rubrivirga sp.]|uniref:hypothetical protein n=1 Tax=Rubrivirga sp. TaxID=1885344 RepID=UPI003C741061